METTIIKKRTSWNKGLSSWNKGLRGVQIAWNKGLHIRLSPQTEFKKGHIPHNKGKKGLQIAWNKDTHITNSGSFKNGHRLLSKSIGEIMKGKSSCKKGMPSLKTTGYKNGNWRGGISKQSRTERQNMMSTIEYKLWRKSCFERDNFTCQISGQSGGKLVVHHINNFADFTELRLAINNGITLSEKIHKEFHKKYGKENNTQEQLEEFLEFIIGQNA